MTKSLLVPSYQSELMLALEELFREIEDLPINEVKDFYNPLKCREDLLPYLAKYLGVTKWDSNVDIEQKRIGCLNALAVNKQKGTLSSLKLALKSLNLNATVTEWWQAQGQAPADENNEMDRKTSGNTKGKVLGEGRFLEKGWAEITLQENEIIYSEEQYKIIYELINEIKRLSLRIVLKKQNAIKGKYYMGGAVNRVSKVQIGYEAVTCKTIEFKHTLSTAGAMYNSKRITIW